MKSPPTRAYLDNTIRETADILIAHHMYNLPVVDRNEIFMGEISTRKLIELLLPQTLSMDRGLTNFGFLRESLQDLKDRLHQVNEHPISRYMATDIEVVYPDSPLIDALDLLRQKYIRVAVVDKDTRRLVGGISFTTLLRALEAHEENSLTI